jgi:hypothetical protein
MVCSEGVGSSLFVFTDQQFAVGYEHMWRHLEVVRRWLILKDAARHVEGRTVAGAQKAAFPVIGQRRLGTDLEFV